VSARRIPVAADCIKDSAPAKSNTGTSRKESDPDYGFCPIGSYVSLTTLADMPPILES
jgi:hypothetical protein